MRAYSRVNWETLLIEPPTNQAGLWATYHAVLPVRQNSRMSDAHSSKFVYLARPAVTMLRGVLENTALERWLSG